MQLASARAVITGGVSGLGLAVAQHLVKHGGKVALFDVNDDKGFAAVAELGEGHATYFRTDVAAKAVLPKWDPEINRAAVQKLADLGTSDGLFPSAPDLDALLP